MHARLALTPRGQKLRVTLDTLNARHPSLGGAMTDFAMNNGVGAGWAGAGMNDDPANIYNFRFDPKFVVPNLGGKPKGTGIFGIPVNAAEELIPLQWSRLAVLTNELLIFANSRKRIVNRTLMAGARLLQYHLQQSQPPVFYAISRLMQSLYCMPLVQTVSDCDGVPVLTDADVATLVGMHDALIRAGYQVHEDKLVGQRIRRKKWLVSKGAFISLAMKINAPSIEIQIKDLEWPLKQWSMIQDVQEFLCQYNIIYRFLKRWPSYFNRRAIEAIVKPWADTPVKEAIFTKLVDAIAYRIPRPLDQYYQTRFDWVHTWIFENLALFGFVDGLVINSSVTTPPYGLKFASIVNPVGVDNQVTYEDFLREWASGDLWKKYKDFGPFKIRKGIYVKLAPMPTEMEFQKLLDVSFTSAPMIKSLIVYYMFADDESRKEQAALAGFVPWDKQGVDAFPGMIVGYADAVTFLKLVEVSKYRVQAAQFPVFMLRPSGTILTQDPEFFTQV